MPATNPLHAANQRRWEAAAANWAAHADSRGLWRRCATEPALVMTDVELQQLANIAGKRVCVLGSGDNQVVFALAGMGACVTSVDIAANQLAVARQRASELRLDIAFVQADVTDLAAITAGTFDVRKDEGSKNAGGNNVGSSNTGGPADASAIAVAPP